MSETHAANAGNASLVWRGTRFWSESIGVAGTFSGGDILLIATVFRLAAFVRANW